MLTLVCLACPGTARASVNVGQTPLVAGFDGEFQNGNWTETTQTFGCGSSSVDASADNVVLTTAFGCGAITALYVHSNADSGASLDGSVEFSYSITQSEAHSYEAIVGVTGGKSTVLTDSVPRQGRMALSIRAGEQVLFQIRKSQGFGESVLTISDFSFTPRTEGFNGSFAPDNWTPTTQAFGCGASTVVASASTVTLSTADGCGQIFAGYSHSNFGTGAPVAGSVAFHYEVQSSEPHAFEAFVSVSETESVMLSESTARSGKIAVSVAAGAQIGFAIRKLSGFGVSSLKISGFSFTPDQAGFVGSYANSKWTPTTQTFGCGSSSVVDSADAIVLATGDGCGQIAALYTHSESSGGAPANGRARFSFQLEQSSDHAYEATAGVAGGSTQILGNSPGGGTIEIPVLAGERLQFAIRKLSGFGVSTLIISDFSFTADAPGFSGAFDHSAWSPSTQSFGCGASSISTSASEVSLASADGCAQIAATYTYSNGGAGVTQSGTVELAYDIDVSTPHPYEVEIGVADGVTLTRADSLPSSGSATFSVEPGDQINFALRKQGSFGVSTLNITGFRFTPRSINFSGELDASHWIATTQTFGCGSSAVTATASTVELATSSVGDEFTCAAILARYSFDRGGAGASEDGMLRLSYDVSDTTGQYLADIVVPGRQSTVLAIDAGSSGALSFPWYAGEQLVIEIRKSSGGSRPTLTISGLEFTPGGGGGIDEPSLQNAALPEPNPPNASCPSGFFNARVSDGPGSGIQPGVFGLEVLLDAPGTRKLAGGLNFGGLIDVSQRGFAAVNLANSAGENQLLNISLSGSARPGLGSSLPVRLTIERRSGSTSVTVFEEVTNLTLSQAFQTTLEVPPGFYVASVAAEGFPVSEARGAPEGRFLFSLTTSFVGRPGGGFQGGAVVGGYHGENPFGDTSGFAAFCLATPHTISAKVFGAPTYGETRGARDLRLQVLDANQQVIHSVP
jgi:hypothetical protein